MPSQREIDITSQNQIAKIIIFLSSILIVLAIIAIVELLPQPPNILINPSDVEVISTSNIRDIRKLGDLQLEDAQITFVPNQTKFIITKQGGDVYIGDYSTGEFIILNDEPFYNQSFAISPDGEKFAIATTFGKEGNVISVWDINEKRQESSFLDRSFSADSIVFSPDGSLLAATISDNAVGVWTVGIWDVVTRQYLGTLTGHTNHINEVVFSPDGLQIASASADKTIRIWDVASKQEIKVLRVNNSQPMDLAYSPLDGCLAAGYGDYIIRFWGTDGGRIVKELPRDCRSVHLAFAQDGLVMASVSLSYRPEARDDNLCFWNTVTGDLLLEMTFPDVPGLYDLGFSSDGKLLALGFPFSDNIEFWGVPVNP